MKYVLDVSVAICWVLPRPISANAVSLRYEFPRQVHELLAPSIFLDETASALTKAERQQDIAIGQAAPLYAKVMNPSARPDPTYTIVRQGHHIFADSERILRLSVCGSRRT